MSQQYWHRGLGSEFVVHLRQSVENPLDFSVILGVRLPKSTTVFRLIRHNGKSHEHSNPLDGDKRFYDFHIHRATERYQVPGCYTEDHYAEPTNAFGDFSAARDYVMESYGFVAPVEAQPRLRGLGGEA